MKIKKLLCLLIVIALLFSLIGCGNSKKDKDSTKKDNTSNVESNINDNTDSNDGDTALDTDSTVSDSDNAEDTVSDETSSALLTGFINNVWFGGDSSGSQNGSQSSNSSVGYDYDPLPETEVNWEDKYGELTASEITPTLNSRYVKVTGRSAALSQGVAVDYSASSISFNAVCCDRVIVTAQTKGVVYFSLYIDGKKQSQRICFTEDGATQTVAIIRSKDKHNFELVRESDMSTGPCAITKIKLARGYFEEKPQNKKYYIEFIGDGITSGQGSLCGFLTGEGLLNVGSTGGAVCGGDDNICTAATYTYAYSAAKRLDADCSFFTHKNVGLTACNGLQNMVSYYTLESKYRNNENFDFASARKPDVVVINLGTVDALAGKSDGAARPQINRLITTIRNSYNDPNLKIVWATGLMGDAKTEITKTFLNGLNDSNIYHISDLPKANGSHGSYPTLIEQETAADKLVSLLQNILK